MEFTVRRAKEQKREKLEWFFPYSQFFLRETNSLGLHSCGAFGTFCGRRRLLPRGTVAPRRHQLRNAANVVESAAKSGFYLPAAVVWIGPALARPTVGRQIRPIHPAAT